MKTVVVRNIPRADAALIHAASVPAAATCASRRSRSGEAVPVPSAA